ncbi:MAG TPA: prenyltransferase/squalene oxidase repeat-containing protein, partial [Chitinophagaceae bacterium]|nr:prenyltransferase/squalene oxidase repeat-containing protein [Chitinophagaceae bacterium]
MKYKYFVTVLCAGLVAVMFLVTSSLQAANLNSALNHLPADDEWSIMAHAAEGSKVGHSYLRSRLDSNTPTDYEKRILAITAIGENPRTFGQENFIAKLESFFDGSQIGDPSLLNDDIFGLLALRSAGIDNQMTDKLYDYIRSNQNSDGGWGFATTVGSDTNTTAMAIAALKTVGSEPNSAIAYLKKAQQPNGGFGYTPQTASDGASTAWVISGFIAARQPVPANAKAYLESLQLSSGMFKWHSNDSSGSRLVTSYAVIALSNNTLPIRILNSTPAPSPSPTPAPVPSPTPVLANNAECVGIQAPSP